MPLRIQKPKERQAQRQFHRTEGLAVVQTILNRKDNFFTVKSLILAQDER